MTEKRQNTLTLFFLLLLILSAVLRVILSIFPKAAVTYNDELFYLELSQNIFLRGLCGTVMTAKQTVQALCEDSES